MIARIVVLSALALSFLAAGFAALWSGVGLILDMQSPTSALEEDMAEWASRQAWLNMLLGGGGPSIGAGLIAGVGALALVVRGRQLAGTGTEPPPTSPSALRRQS